MTATIHYGYPSSILARRAWPREYGDRETYMVTRADGAEVHLASEEAAFEEALKHDHDVVVEYGSPSRVSFYWRNQGIRHGLDHHPRLDDRWQAAEKAFEKADHARVHSAGYQDE